MAKSVSEMLSAISSVIDQSASLPTGDELLTRISYLNDAQNEWANAYEWDEMKQSMTVGASGASVGLADNFIKFKSPLYDMVNNQEYLEINPGTRYRMDSQDKYVFILNTSTGSKYMGINPTSSNTLTFDYLSFPTSLASLNDTTICSNPQFLEQRVVERILFSRSDPRFPSEDGKASKTLSDMVTSQDVGSGAKQNKIPSFLDGRYVIGQ